MKRFMFDALMLTVGCLLWVILGALMIGFVFLFAWISYQVCEFANYQSLWLAFAYVPLLAITVAMSRVAVGFWCEYC